MRLLPLLGSLLLLYCRSGPGAGGGGGRYNRLGRARGSLCIYWSWLLLSPFSVGALHNLCKDKYKRFYILCYMSDSPMLWTQLTLRPFENPSNQWPC